MSIFKKNYKLSIIIPCYNSSKTIYKTLNSIIDQRINKSLYEVIICNDSNTDNYLDMVKKYKKIMNIKICNTHTKVHCPGNTRQVGLENCSGEYITFIDHDDIFLDEQLKKVLNYIDGYKGNNPVIQTELIAVEEGRESIVDNYHAFSFLHGKFYNLKFLKENNISFKKNILGYEDIYFNNMVMNILYKKDILSFEYLDIITYKWNYSKDSISHRTERGYLHDNFYWTLYSLIYPFINEKTEINERQVMTALIRNYYHYEASIYKYDKKDYEDNYYILVDYIKLIKSKYNIDNQYIIDYMKSIKDITKLIKQDVINFEGEFKEEKTFNKFIKEIGD